ncbi:unnamed protein product, partial [Mesorhabditis belari]|uniref:Deoxyribonuclease TATDN1 n=1 Tax=Mesorhabditis belari TaxID=2138241 RepID=A0AAF3FA03_9BILA
MPAMTPRVAEFEKVERRTAYELVEIGANLFHEAFQDDFEGVLRRSKQAGITKMMLTACCEKTSREVCEMAEREPGFLYFTTGFHPYYVNNFRGTASIETFREYASHPQCVAIGECGLDYSSMNESPRDVQFEAFRQQLELAVELRKPLFLHERDAFEDFVSILSKFEDQLPPAVVHCFTGTAEEAATYLDMGFYIGVTGFVANNKLGKTVRDLLASEEIPLERLMIETDAPYLYPRVNDRKFKHINFSKEALDLHKYSSHGRTEPCSLAVICELIAGLMQRDPIEVAQITTENAKKVYGLM